MTMLETVKTDPAHDPVEAIARASKLLQFDDGEVRGNALSSAATAAELMHAALYAWIDGKVIPDDAFLKQTAALTENLAEVVERVSEARRVLRKAMLTAAGTVSDEFRSAIDALEG